MENQPDPTNKAKNQPPVLEPRPRLEEMMRRSDDGLKSGSGFYSDLDPIGKPWLAIENVFIVER